MFDNDLKYDIRGVLSIKDIDDDVRLNLARLAAAWVPVEHYYAFSLFEGNAFWDELKLCATVDGDDIRDRIFPFLAWVSGLRGKYQSVYSQGVEGTFHAYPVSNPREVILIEAKRGDVDYGHPELSLRWANDLAVYRLPVPEPVEDIEETAEATVADVLAYATT